MSARDLVVRAYAL